MKLDRRSFFKLATTAVAAAAIPGKAIAAITEIIEDPLGGWLFADGRPVSREKYAKLYAIIGDTFGRTDDKFNLPDFRMFYEAVPDTGGAYASLPYEPYPGGYGVQSEPCHTHTFSVNDPGHQHSIGRFPMRARAVRQFNHLIKVRDTYDDSFPVGALIPYAGSTFKEIP